MNLMCEVFFAEEEEKVEEGEWEKERQYLPKPRQLAEVERQIAINNIQNKISSKGFQFVLLLLVIIILIRILFSFFFPMYFCIFFSCKANFPSLILFNVFVQWEKSYFVLFHFYLSLSFLIISNVFVFVFFFSLR